MQGRYGFSANLLQPSGMQSSLSLCAVARSKAGASVLQAKKITDYLLFSSLQPKCMSGVIRFDFPGLKFGRGFKQFVSSVMLPVTATTHWEPYGHGI